MIFKKVMEENKVTTVQTNVYDELWFEKWPYAPAWWPVMSKVLVWLVVWFLISFLVFLVIFMLGTDTFTSDTVSFLPFILLLVSFVTTFIGNTMIMWAYNLFFSERYYDFSKMFGMVLLTNAILFFLFIFIYVMWDIRDNSILMILAFHLLLSIFISYNIIEFLPNPQYSTSSFVGNTIWFAFAIVIYLIVYNTTKLSADSVKMYHLMLWPAILAYTLIPLSQWIRQNIYRWFYEKWNDFFYLPTEKERLEETVFSEEEIIQKEKVNVEE